MAERPEDLNLPNAVITRIIKEAVGAQRGCGRAHGHTDTHRQTDGHSPPGAPCPAGSPPKAPGGFGALWGIGSEAGTA